MKKEIIQDLVKLANLFDKRAMKKEADFLDQILKSATTDIPDEGTTKINEQFKKWAADVSIFVEFLKDNEHNYEAEALLKSLKRAGEAINYSLSLPEEPEE